MEKTRLKKIFDEKYIIPCFQREYSWDEEEIKGLIDDIKLLKKDYCLGVITIKQSKKYKELIDGQQRLITLYMIAIRCKYIYKKEEIKIDSELTFILNKNLNGLKYLLKGNEERVNSNLLRGWKLVDKHIKKIEKAGIDIRKSLEGNYIYVYEINLNDTIDINHYFEVMNSRGVQLSRSDIIKSYLMNKFDQDSENQARLNYMWYIFEKMDTKSNSIKEFETISTKYKNEYKSINTIINNYSRSKDNEKTDKNEDMSILNFEFFLLYVIRLYNKRDNLPCDYDGEFNIKDMIAEYEETFEKATKEEIISFLNFMIKIKTVYNQFVVKNKGNTDNWKIEKTNNQRMILLQACMRVSFVNRKVMHWLFITLGYFYKNNDINKYIKYMEDYIKNHYISKYKEKAEKIKNPYETGFDTPIIVLNYLDYWMRFNKNKIRKLIPEARNIDFEKFTFKFRNSIEHFMPRHNENKNNPEWVHEIGNLALLSYSTNTRMQNAYPKVKSEHFKDEGLEKYSIKLQIMSKITLKRGWDKQEINKLTEKTKKIIEEILKEN